MLSRRPPRALPIALVCGVCTAALAGPRASDPEDFAYQTLADDRGIEVRLDADSPHFEFRSGDSPFAAFRLPERAGRYLVDVIAPLDPPADPTRSRVFYPALALLSDHYTVLRTSEPGSWYFSLPEMGLTSEPAYRVTVEIDGQGPERYLVVYTPRDAATTALPGASDRGRLRLRLYPLPAGD